MSAVCSSSCLCVWCAVFSCSFLCRGGLFVHAVFSAVGGVLIAILAFFVGWLSVSCVGVSGAGPPPGAHSREPILGRGGVAEGSPRRALGRAPWVSHVVVSGFPVGSQKWAAGTVRCRGVGPKMVTV